jgi:outer membrane protein OmpA-like peptidoglycan-associated protein
MTLCKLSAVALALSLIACSSSVKKTDISATANPSDEISKLGADIDQGYSAHLDVLANEEFAQAQKYLREAKDDLSGNQGQKEVLEDVSYGRSYLAKANEKADVRKGQIAALIDAREKALKAGAKEYPPTRAQLTTIDDDVRSNADSFNKMDPDQVSTIQNQYLDVELAAIKNAQLGQAQAQITGARKASSYAPKSLKRAEMDVKSAENIVTANRNSPTTYSSAVTKANQSAALLGAVLAATQNGKVDEATAINLVAQQHKISNLEGELDTANVESEQMGTAMAKQGEQLKANAHVISLQRSLESARNEFTKDEADVFQQGDRLLIRLKSMNFTSGGADLPSDSLAVLAKVKTVAGDLGPKAVIVEGHTDSVGGKAANQKLSQSRASAVAKYLNTNGIEESSIRAVGYGYSKPIASNKSSAGRSQNRRVDIVITPGTPEHQSTH